MKEYRWTIIGFAVAVLLGASSIIFNLDLFEAFVSSLKHHEAKEIDELIFPISLFYFFAVIDLARKHHRNQVEMEKLRVYRSMMQAMNHILNNFLQKMMLFKMTAEETEGFDKEVLEKYDQIIDEATAQIRALSRIASPTEEEILKTIDPDGKPN